ncbi:MAG: hypothetical protein CVV27_04145, partial [Candidatus Melainabacteria bacterium HGW-Melainabacteria-1]
MHRLKWFACLTACLLATANPALAQVQAERLPSQFLELSANQQQSVSAVRQLYNQVSELWLELRLDPSVDADGVRKQLDGVSEQLNGLEKAGKADSSDLQKA